MEQHWENVPVAKALEVLIDCTILIFKAATRTYREKMSRLRTLCSNNPFVEIILKNYVRQSFLNLGNNKRWTITKLKRAIQNTQNPSSVIIVGQSGSGKSTALKWLFLHINSRVYNHIIFIPASCKELQDCNNLSEVIAVVEAQTRNRQRCIVFFDGFDELPCIKGDELELEALLDYFGGSLKEHRIVLSTRSEHFELRQKLNDKCMAVNTDGFIVCEIMLPTNHDIYKLCKLVKKLNAFERNIGCSSHFINKYPSKNDAVLPEREYLRKVKHYVKRNPSSLLTIPMLSRYAFQIISDWNEKGNSGFEYISLYKKLEKTINAIVKWEYHDTYKSPTKNNKYAEKDYEKYKLAVFDFLTDVAGELKTNGLISKNEWNAIAYRQERDINFNSLFCVLIEHPTGDLSFMHRAFEEFFMSRYFAKASCQTLTAIEQKRLQYHLLSSVDFARMYVEHIFTLGNSLGKQIQQSLSLENYAVIESVTEFAQGRNTSFFLCKNSLLSVDRILDLFPASTIVWAGDAYTKATIERIKETDCLTVSDPMTLEGYNIYQLLPNGIGQINFQVGRTIFWKMHMFICVDDYMNDTVSIQFSSLQEEPLLFDDYYKLIKRYVSMNEPLDDADNYVSESQMASNLISKLTQAESSALLDYFKRIVVFLHNSLNCYWGYFDNNQFTVCLNTEKCLEILKNRFLINAAKSWCEYIVAYGIHKSKTQNIEIALNNIKNQELAKVQIDFLPIVESDFDHVKRNGALFSNVTENYLREIYYTLFFGNYHEFELLNNHPSIANIKTIRHAPFTLSNIRFFLNKLDNSELSDRLRLMISDEMLRSCYIHGLFSDMIEISLSTLELCVNQSHDFGRRIRECILDQDIDDYSKQESLLSLFSQNRIWIWY